MKLKNNKIFIKKPRKKSEIKKNYFFKKIIYDKLKLKD